MAITRETELQRLEVYPDGRLMVVYVEKFDDPDDDQLPTQSNRVVHLSNGQDVSSHLDLVQAVATAAWAEVGAPADTTEVQA